MCGQRSINVSTTHDPYDYPFSILVQFLDPPLTVILRDSHMLRAIAAIYYLNSSNSGGRRSSICSGVISLVAKVNKSNCWMTATNLLDEPGLEILLAAPGFGFRLLMSK